ncbi:MAG: DUF1257 domain-containing protein [Lentisphaerae bacterium]|jgi:hypothetical protein|nr:DUF1257 domain-containing protein [Lentisphaerota bacterium]MBT4822133.1 DUF1257 domain-containing protein [Lentisphaerota bacterium]MBT5610528.1 DUF1257 domain-containing protein [Lentisphaerota bacterium]MBT7056083.1 DUF1257 domain-containing protein [Lentisphaerota bacterium]MBT7842440.1 DUF1257 domain-containing protein [Lentisphaerota bacterium]
MSHFATIQTEVHDIDALRAACHELGVLLLDDAEARGYGSNRRHGDHVIRLKGPYDVAVNREETGTYGLTTDWWGGHVEQEVGKNYGGLLQLYGVHKTVLEARRRGFSVRRQQQKDGAIKLSIGGVTA